MPKLKPKKRKSTQRDRNWYVDLIESEAGWGQRTDETRKFRSKISAAKYSKDYNKEYNTSKTVPSWYIYATEPYQKSQ